MSQNWPGTPVSNSPAPSAPQPIIAARPTPAQQQGLENDNTRTGIAVRGEARTDADRTIGNTQTLRKEFYALPQVQNYQTQVQAFASALGQAPNANGDQALITAYAKMLDPGSVVREGEFNTVANADSAVGKLVAKIQKEGGFDGAGMLRPQIRQNIRHAMLTLVKEANDAYNQQRVFYKDMAQRQGVNPDDVIGPHFGAPYAKQIEQAFAPQQPQGGAINPEMRGGFPVGTQTRIGFDSPDAGPFDREAFVRETYGLSPEQEIQMVGFWNSNRGNAGLTPDNARAWYQQNGIRPPDDASLAKMVEDARKGFQFSPIDTTPQEEAYKARLQSRLDQMGFDPTSADEYGNRFAEGALLGNGDEMIGALGAVKNLFSNKGVADGYTEYRDLARMASEQRRDQQGVSGYATEFAGGLVPGLATGGGSSVANAARVGGAMGAVAGFGYGEGAADSLTGAAVGGVTGAALGAGGQKAFNSWAARSAGQAPSEGAQVIAAADRLNAQTGANIQPMPADVAGATTRVSTAGVAKTTLGARPIVEGGEAVTREATSARDALARMIGNPETDVEVAGGAAIDAAEKYIKSSRAKVGVLYERARKLAGDTEVEPVNAIATIERNLDELAGTPGGTEAGKPLADLLFEMRGKTYSVEGIKRMRTTLRDKFVKDGLRGSDLERRVNQVIDAADDDIVDSLVAEGKTNAAKAYRAASQAHRERVSLIDEVLAPIIGKKGEKSGEDVMKAIGTLTKGNNARLSKFLGALPPEDAANLRATLLSRLGRASDGQQNAAGDAFSLSTFLTQWNGMTPGAKRTLFGGELRAALDDLAKVAEGTKSAQRYANHSNTGSVMGGAITGGLVTQIASNPILAIGGMAAQYGLGKLLSSAKFARWLARVPSSQSAMPAYVSKLSNIAATDSVIAADALGLQRQLQQAFGSGQGSPAALVPLRAAAQPPAGQADGERTNTAAGPR